MCTNLLCEIRQSRILKNASNSLWQFNRDRSLWMNFYGFSPKLEFRLYAPVEDKILVVRMKSRNWGMMRNLLANYSAKTWIYSLNFNLFCKVFYEIELICSKAQKNLHSYHSSELWIKRTKKAENTAFYVILNSWMSLCLTNVKVYRKSSRSNSNVSPSIGLNGFPKRSQLQAKALTANAAMCWKKHIFLFINYSKLCFPWNTQLGTCITWWNVPWIGHIS